MLRSLTTQIGPGAKIDVKTSSAILGRAGPKADIALPDHPLLHGLISRQHALLQIQDGSSSMLVTDRSLNGTWAMAPGQKLQRLQPGVPTSVAAGSTLYFGGKEVVQDLQGKLTPNPYVYLFLGPCRGAHRQQQEERVQRVQQSVAAAAYGRQLQQQPQLPLEHLQELHQAPQQQQQQQQVQLVTEQQPQEQQQQVQLVTEQQQQQQVVQVLASKRPRLLELQPSSQLPELADADLLQQVLEHADEHAGVKLSSAVRARQQQEQQHMQDHHHHEQQQQQHGAGAAARSFGALTELDPNLLSPQAARHGAAAGGGAGGCQGRLGCLASSSSSIDAAVRGVVPPAVEAAAASSHGVSKDHSKGKDAAAAPEAAAAAKGKSSDTEMRQVSCSSLECAICKDLLAASHLLACGHWYCGVCLAQWLELRQEPSCPSCRAAVKSAPVRVFAIDSMVAEAQLNQGSESQEHAARLQQWADIQEATRAHWEQRFQPEVSSSKGGSSRRGGRGAAAQAAQQQQQPRIPAGVLPLLGGQRGGAAAAAGQAVLQAGAAAQQQQQQLQGWRVSLLQQPASTRRQTSGTGRRRASGTAAAAVGGRWSARQRRTAGGAARRQAPAPSRQAAGQQLALQQLQQQHVDVPQNLRQMAIDAFAVANGASAGGLGMH